MEDVIGWAGNILLSITGPALVLECFAFKREAKSLPITFLWIWFVGEILSWLFIILMQYEDAAPLHFNYGLNTLCVAIVIGYYYRDYPHNDL